MSNQNFNREEYQPDHYENHLQMKPPYQKDELEISALYGMTPQQYREGTEIHCRCFSEINKVNAHHIDTN